MDQVDQVDQAKSRSNRVRACEPAIISIPTFGQG